MTNHNEPDDHQHREATDSYEHTFDPGTDSVSEELVRAVAALNDADPTELAVLAEVLDPEALDALFQTRPDGHRRETNGRVVFEYHNHEIQITTDGTISIGSKQSNGDD